MNIESKDGEHAIIIALFATPAATQWYNNNKQSQHATIAPQPLDGKEMLFLVLLYSFPSAIHNTKSDLYKSGGNGLYHDAYLTSEIKLIEYNSVVGSSTIIKKPTSVVESEVLIGRKRRCIVEDDEDDNHLPTAFTLDIEVNKWRKQQYQQ